MTTAPRRLRLPQPTLGRLAAISFGLAALLLAYLIRRYGVNVPNLDDWNIVTIFAHYHQHSLSFHDLWAQHNEHRPFFPQLIMLALAIMTKWNQIPELWFSFVVAVGVCGFLEWQVLKLRAYRIMPVALLLPWLLLSPAQWENWLWGWQIEWFLMVAAVVATIWVLVLRPWPQRDWVNVVLAGLAATVATYSVGNGGLIWLVGLGVLVLQRRRWPAVVSWVVAGLAVVATYVYHYVPPADAYPNTLILHQPINFARYLAVLVGRPLGYDTQTAAIAGIIVMVVLVLSAGYLLGAGRKALPAALPWMALGAFALLSAGMISFARFGASYQQAMSSRYYIISSLVVLATLVLASICLHLLYAKTQTPAIPGMVVAGVVVAAIVFNNYFYGNDLMVVQQQNLQKVKQCVHQATSANDACLLLTYPSKSYVWRQIQELKRLHWAGF